MQNVVNLMLYAITYPIYHNTVCTKKDYLPHYHPIQEENLNRSTAYIKMNTCKVGGRTSM